MVIKIMVQGGHKNVQKRAADQQLAVMYPTQFSRQCLENLIILIRT